MGIACETPHPMTAGLTGSGPSRLLHRSRLGVSLPKRLISHEIRDCATALETRGLSSVRQLAITERQHRAPNIPDLGELCRRVWKFMQPSTENDKGHLNDEEDGKG